MSSPNPLQLDALKEVTNIGCGRAANALSQMVGGRKVEIGVPDVRFAAVEQLPELVGGPDAPVVAAQLGMTGGLKGHLLLLLPEDDAFRLAGLLLNAQTPQALSDIQRSALAEAANILASACLSAIGTLTGLTLMPTTPVVTEAPAGQVMDQLFHSFECSKGLLLVLEASFFMAAVPRLHGKLLLLPDEASLPTLFARLGV